jgi:hypothetical protein
MDRVGTGKTLRAKSGWIGKQNIIWSDNTLGGGADALFMLGEVW